jgi:hypothetical protein
MVSATLWIEVTMSGFGYLAALLFIMLPSDAKQDIQTVVSLKDLLPYLSALIIGASYTFGVLAHRVTGLAITIVRKALKRGHLYRLIEVYSGRRSDDAIADVWQFGSSRIQREVDFQFGLLILLRSFLFSIPLLTFSSARWLSAAHLGNVRDLVWLSAALWLVCLIAHHRQAELNFRAVHAATAVCSSVRSHQMTVDGASK